jgi:hypothetical protein
MGDRTDIDALLIGALYGELTPADEARLTAHLESHPADRTALADMTRTREAVRSSRILSVQLEPPQSVSARLIQEAARRLPRVERHAAGWFYRFTRVLLAHPAMAVAAMFVVVLGVAGVVHVRRDQFAETMERSMADEPSGNAAPPPMAETPSMDTGARGQGLAGAGSAKNTDPAAQPAAPEADYRVGLAEPSIDDQREAKIVADVDRRRKLEAPAEPAKELARFEPKPMAPQKPAATPALTKKGAGIVVRSPDPMPKDLEERNEVARPDGRVGRGDVANQQTRTADGAAPTGGFAVAPPSAPAPAPATVTSLPGADADAPNLDKSKVPARQASAGKVAQDTAPSAAPAASATRPPPPRAEGPSQRDSRKLADRSAGQAEGKAADEKVSEDNTLLGWARKQHDQVIALAKSSKCEAAATVATEIYSRAPEYYAANVATDRSVKPCVVYLNREREREERSRAASKRASPTEAPATPAPSKK